MVLIVSVHSLGVDNDPFYIWERWRSGDFYAHYLAWGVPDTKGFNRKQFLQSNDDFRNIKKQTRVSSQQAKQEKSSGGEEFWTKDHFVSETSSRKRIVMFLQELLGQRALRDRWSTLTLRSDVRRVRNRQTSYGSLETHICLIHPLVFLCYLKFNK